MIDLTRPTVRHVQRKIRRNLRFLESRDVRGRCILFINERGRMKKSLGKYEDVPVREGIPCAKWHHFLIYLIHCVSNDRRISIVRDSCKFARAKPYVPICIFAISQLKVHVRFFKNRTVPHAIVR